MRKQRLINRPPLPLFLALALAAIAAITACSGVPSNPARTRYSRQLGKAQPYYKTLRTGMFSRAVTLQPESYAWQLLQTFAKHWSTLDEIPAAEALATFLDTHEMKPLAVRVRQALAAGKNERPKNAKPALEAAAIKQGLLEAHKRLEQEGERD